MRAVILYVAMLLCCGPVMATSVSPSAETTPVHTAGDAADDPAIWVNHEHPKQSLIIGTDKERGLELYSLSGKRLQTVVYGDLNNVDIADHFLMGDERIALVVASDHTHDALAFFKLDTKSRRLVSLGRAPVAFEYPYGLCVYTSDDGKVYAFMSDLHGHVDQWRLTGTDGTIEANKVRELTFDSQTEGCTVDKAHDALYVAEEDVGVWRLPAAPDAGNTRKLIGRTGNAGHLTADAEGMDVYLRHDGSGYLIVSSQGSDSYAVYSLAEGNAYLGSFQITGNGKGVDGTSHTDGLAVAAGLRTTHYPLGLLVVQDDRNTNPKAHQDFKFVSFADVIHVLALKK